MGLALCLCSVLLVGSVLVVICDLFSSFLFFFPSSIIFLLFFYIISIVIVLTLLSLSSLLLLFLLVSVASGAQLIRVAVSRAPPLAVVSFVVCPRDSPLLSSECCCCVALDCCEELKRVLYCWIF